MAQNPRTNSYPWDWDRDTNFARSQGLGPGLKVLGRLGLGLKSLGRPGTETLWDSCPWDSNPLGLLGRPMPIPGPRTLISVDYREIFSPILLEFKPLLCH